MSVEKDGQLLEQLEGTKKSIQGRQIENLQKMYKNNQKGVNADATF